ncbi:DUF3830 family protein [Pararhizobium sp.]|uniref:DUF3830 family protein n=1 Tax=Pararhizobium sp. TaxID=1977563 RepID=UPI00271FB3A8|nr:DUF3830 family protein [Pararhizobium sp.]MDO9417483.1 DUF3830 family protein [Pararhizobium sp.]
MPDLLRITVGPFAFTAALETERAPETCRIFKNFLPFRNKVIHSRWSGEAVWVPLGDFDFGAGFENHTCHPSRGDILLYPGGHSETELLFAYGSSSFASKMGALAGNHVLTIIDGREQLEAMGKMILWEGAQPISFEAV